jgi:dTDP-4-dehydrorhamnose 3,5-epimerase-like enzyme
MALEPLNPKLGTINDVYIWSMSKHPDLRGNLIKAHLSENKHQLPFNFDTREHFFTESKKNVFRGMHFQGAPHSVSKVISIVSGKALDFLFDMREASTSFGLLQLTDLDEKSPVSVYIPKGVAHGYISLAEDTIISYRMDGSYCQNCDAGISGEFLSPLMPIPFAKTIKSTRDFGLTEFTNFQYSSECGSTF